MTEIFECTKCLDSKLKRWAALGPYREYAAGFTHSIKEPHWQADKANPQLTIGLTVTCFYSVYMNLLRQAREHYSASEGITSSRISNEGRIALVRASACDILGVAKEESSRTPDSGIQLKVSRLKVLDLIDKLPVIPSEAILTDILEAPSDWHQNWHYLVDRIQLKKWRDFPAKMTATLRSA